MKKKLIAVLKTPAAALTISGLVLIGSGVYAYTHLKSHTPASDVMVRRGDITEIVSLTGTVTSKSHADLSFATSGRIAMVYHSSGEYVGQGALIAALDISDLDANRVQAQAALAIEQSKLSDMEAGSDTIFDRDQTALLNTAEDAYAKADDAVRNYADSFYTNAETMPDFGVTIQNNGTTLVFGAKTYDEKIKLDDERAAIGTMLSAWRDAEATAAADPVAFAALSKSDLDVVRGFLNDIAFVTDSFSVTDLSYQPAIDGLKAKITAARSSVSAALSSLIAAENTLPNAGAKAIQQAQVARAQAAVDGIDAAIAKAEIRAPFSGVLAKNDAHAGEIAIPNIPIATVIATGYSIDAYASEADVAKIKTGDKASVVLDAYGSSTSFAGTVATIDAAQTIQNGIGSYRVSIALADAGTAIADGMHATISIATGTKQDVLLIPARAIIRRGDQNVVLANVAGAPVERAITTGISDGVSIEVLSGLSEGDHIISLGQ